MPLHSCNHQLHYEVTIEKYAQIKLCNFEQEKKMYCSWTSRANISKTTTWVGLKFFKKMSIITYNQFAFFSKSVMWVCLIFGAEMPYNVIDDYTSAKAQVYKCILFSLLCPNPIYFCILWFYHEVLSAWLVLSMIAGKKTLAFHAEVIFKNHKIFLRNMLW